MKVALTSYLPLCNVQLVLASGISPPNIPVSISAIELAAHGAERENPAKLVTEARLWLS